MYIKGAENNGDGTFRSSMTCETISADFDEATAHKAGLVTLISGIVGENFLNCFQQVMNYDDVRSLVTSSTEQYLASSSGTENCYYTPLTASLSGITSGLVSDFTKFKFLKLTANGGSGKQPSLTSAIVVIGPTVTGIDAIKTDHYVLLRSTNNVVTSATIHTSGIPTGLIYHPNEQRALIRFHYNSIAVGSNAMVTEVEYEPGWTSRTSLGRANFRNSSHITKAAVMAMNGQPWATTVYSGFCAYMTTSITNHNSWFDKMHEVTLKNKSTKDVSCSRNLSWITQSIHLIN